MNTLKLTNAQLEEMLAHVKEQAPLEACGLLSGRDDRVEKVYLVENQAKSPQQFVMDPLQQLRVFEEIEEDGLELAAIFHSHPAGPEAVSATDVEQAAYPVVHIVLARQNGSETWSARGFWIENRAVTEVNLQIL